VLQNGVPAGGTTPAPADTVGAGQININTDFNWSDFSKVTTSQGTTYNLLKFINAQLHTNMSSTQFGTLIIIHELEHNVGIDKEGMTALGQIYADCISK
jgi:hypothetical protein